MERWKPVVGWEDEYEVSDQGRVRSVLRPVACGVHTRTAGGEIMKQSATGKYRSVNLSKGGKRTNRLVHLLVLEAFVGPRPPGCRAMKRPGSSQKDCRLENWQWAEFEQFCKRTDPTPEEIERSCREIRASLSDAELENRWHGLGTRRWLPPVYSLKEISEDLDDMVYSIDKEMNR